MNVAKAKRGVARFEPPVSRPVPHQATPPGGATRDFRAVRTISGVKGNNAARFGSTEALLWARYTALRSIKNRNKLIEHYLPIVKINAERMKNSLPAHVLYDELHSAAVRGLMQAVETFDPQRGYQFISLAQPRMRGAMLDWLREMDWSRRRGGEKQRRMAVAQDRLIQSAGRTPTEEELAGEMGIGLDGMMKLIRSAPLVHVGRLPMEGDFEKAIEVRGTTPEETAEAEDGFHALLKCLSRRDRLIFVLLYQEGMSMRQAGITVGLSESRVSQIHASAIQILRAVHGRKGSEGMN